MQNCTYFPRSCLEIHMKFPSVSRSVTFSFDIAQPLAAKVLPTAGRDGFSALHSPLHSCVEVAWKGNLPQLGIPGGSLCRIQLAKTKKYSENVQTPHSFRRHFAQQMDA